LDPPGVTSPVTYVATGLPPNATFDAETATFHWVPSFESHGVYTVVFTATDDGDGTGTPLSSVVSVDLVVRNVNRPPQIDSIGNVSVQRGEVVTLHATAFDPDGNFFTLWATSALPGFALPDFITFTHHSLYGANFVIAPGPGDRGNYTISLHAQDDGDGQGPGAALTVERSFVVTVESDNDPPVIQADQEPLAYTLSGLPANATLTPPAVYGHALLEWTPTASDIGSHSVTVTVTDAGNGDPGRILEDLRSFTIVVRSNNAAPVIDAMADPTSQRHGR
jgi:hypothetical protein